MLPEIETFRKPVFGAAITWDGAKEPTFVIPFAKLDIVKAYAVDERTVLFVGRRPHGGGSTTLAVYDLSRGRLACHRELQTPYFVHPLMSGNRETLILSDSDGITVLDATNLEILRRIELYRADAGQGALTTYDAFDAGGPVQERLDRGRYQCARKAGWHQVGAFRSYDVNELDAGRLLVVNRAAGSFTEESDHRRCEIATLNWRLGTVTTEVIHDSEVATALDIFDPNANLLHVSGKQLAIFLASPPRIMEKAGPFACPDPSEHALVLHLWRLGGVDADPRTIVARTAGFDVWSAALAANRVQRRPGEPALADAIARLRMPSPDGEIRDPYLWMTAAGGLLGAIYEDPRDGLLWLSFSDNCIRSLDDQGRLGPMIRLAGEGNMERDQDLLLAHCPVVAFQGASSIIVRMSTSWMMARYVFRASDVAGRTDTVTLQPAKPGPLPGSHAKAFAAYVRSRRRDRFALHDWSRDSVAEALEAQRATIAAGMPDLVDPEEDRLTFSYRVAGKPVKEAAFFRRIVRDALPVVPELRALLTAYTDALGEGGEGVQPWQDPDEGVGGLGPALHALALLDPDCVDVLRAYLETRDGEHEGFCLDTVVPAFFERHGWRDAAAVRFGIYATLNRSWGGRQPAEGFDGLRDAMARFLTPGEAAEAVLRDAEHFGQKPDWGYDAAAYRAAFRSLLDAANPFEAALRDALGEPPPAPAG